MRRLLLAGALAIAAVLRVYSIASAHVTLVSSEPAAGSRLTASPSRLRLEFSEPVEARMAKVSIVRGDGHATELSVAGDPRNAYVLLAPIAALDSGAFRLVWHVVSADGHPVMGSFVFTVGSGVATPAEAPPVPDSVNTLGPSVAGAPTIGSLLRGTGVGLLAGLAGLLFFIVTLGAPLDSRPMRVALGLAVATVVLLGAHLVVWLMNAAPDHRLSMAWATSAFSSTVGRVELWRTLLTLLPVWALALARRPGLALVLTGPSLLLSAAVGHSAAFHPMLSIPFKAVHLIALAAWLGGLLWLVVRQTSDTERLSTETARVSTVALWGVIAIALSGVIQTVLLIPTFAGLRSAYGLMILIKVAGLLILIAFGAYHRSRLMPRLARGETAAVLPVFGASLRREIAVFWLVVIAGGLLANVSPPAADAAAPLTASESHP